MTKRLVLLLDGTWNTNDKGGEPTNVVNLLRAIPPKAKDGTHQVLYYGRGVGSWKGTKFRGGLGGMGLNRNLTDAYRFLGNNYNPGDEIHIFGFSRGAYTARSLAGLIGMVGILPPQHLGSTFDDVMDAYRHRHHDDHEKNKELKKKAINDIVKDKTRPKVPIKCVGVWDTVGSLGIPGDWSRKAFASRWYFHDVHIGPHIEVALHALAIDEKRSAFAPTLWEKRKGEILHHHVEQVWFPGVHSNIGGSYAKSELSKITLDWMIKRIRALTKLEVMESAPDLAGRDIESHIDGRGIENRGIKYGVLMADYLHPYLRTLGGIVAPGYGQSRRNIPRDNEETINEYLHISALQRWQLEQVEHDAPKEGPAKPLPYRPANLVALMKHIHNQSAADIAVIGWDGEIMPPEQIPWPSGL